MTRRLISGRVAAIGLLFAVSGASALVYQVAWQRILALATGVGVYSVAVIAASFMAGLGVGSQLGGAWSARVSPRTALRAFALLELGVGLFAVVSPSVYYDLLYERGGRLYANPLAAGLLHLLSLGLPTTLMGMTLPFLVRAVVETTTGAAQRIGWLYAVNTLGAAAGAFLTPWLLIRELGVAGAVYAGALGNVLVATGSMWLGSRSAAAPTRSPGNNDEAAPEAGVSLPAWTLLYALSGAIALALEIVWFRIVEVGVKATAFTFGTVLALYLAGLGFGTLAGIRWAPRFTRPLRVFLLCQCGLLVSALLAVGVVAYAPLELPLLRWFGEYWARTKGFRLGHTSDPGLFWRLYLLWPLALYAVPTFLMGVSFVALQRAVQRDPETSSRRVGLLQAANIAGCAAGSLLVGVVALDHLGTSGTLRVLALLGLVFALLGMRKYGVRSVFGALSAALVALAWTVPSRDRLWSRLHGQAQPGGLWAEDATSVVGATADADGRYVFWTNGRGLSWLPYGGLHTLLGAIPAIVHPDPQDVAIIGLASGDTAWAAACRRETRRVRVFEIAAPQQLVLRRLLATNPPRHLPEFLSDARIRVTLADGRNALLREERQYDLVEADALLPYASGSGNLYSLEFFELAARRLKPGGVMCTWAPTPRVRATFCRVFPHVLSFAGELVLVGSQRPLEVETQVWVDRLLGPPRPYLLPINSGDVLRGLLTGKRFDCAAEAAGLNRDLDPLDEFGAATAPEAGP